MKKTVRANERLPIGALVLGGGTLALQEPVEVNGIVPVRVKARDGGAIDHWYWGRFVHDFAGMRLSKPRLPLDYGHDDTKLLGYLDAFDWQTGDLWATGAIVPYGDSDLAAEVVHKARNGVPYEASILFDGPLRTEEVAAGESVQVNGRTIQGPVLVMREWVLRGVAVVPWGADPNTATILARNLADAWVMVERETCLMAESAISEKEELRRYIAAFGAEVGAQWWLAGRNYEECLAEHAAALAAEAEKLRTELADLRRLASEGEQRRKELEAEVGRLGAELAAAKERAARLEAAVGRGEPEPVSFQAEGGGSGREAQLARYIGPRLARFAAALKISGNNGNGG